MTIKEFIIYAEQRGVIEDLLEQKAPISDHDIAAIAAERLNKRYGTKWQIRVVQT